MEQVTNRSYAESQPNHWFITWIIVLGIAAYIWMAVYHQIILNEPVGSKPAPDSVLIMVWLLFGILFPAGIIKSRLTLSIDDLHVTYQFFPLHLNEHTLPVRQIKSIESVQIRPILDFGGWGIRYGFKGKGYIMNGRKGIKINFRSGRPVYFTTKNPDLFVEVFERVKRG